MSHTDIWRTTSARIPTSVGNFQLCHYTNRHDEKEHLALVIGDVSEGERVLVRVHSECMTGDVFGSLRCDCGEQLHAAMRQIAEAGSGVIIYLRQEGRGIGLAEKLRAYNLQDEGYDTVEANLLLGHQADEREYWAAVGILADLQIRSIRLLTNNPLKIEHLRAQGIDVVERVPLEPSFHAENVAYLETKVRRMRHLLHLPTTAPPTVNGVYLPPVLAQRIDELREHALIYAEENGRPYVTVSYAQSIDGSIAAGPGAPLALSGPVAMTLTHALRAAHDAILVGIGTVMADDPQLTVRLVAGANPQPVVVDSTLRFPADARLLQHPRGVWIATTSARHEQTSLAASARIIEVPPDTQGHVDLGSLLRELGRRGIRNLMVEGGAQVLTSFIQQGLAQSVVITIVPRLVGGLHALNTVYPNGTHALTAPVTPRMTQVTYTPAGDDLVVWAGLETESAGATRPRRKP